jgi:adenosine kinase
MHIYISGSLAYDRIMNFQDRFANHILPEKIHILNVCFLVNDLKEKFGGTAGNIAFSLSLLNEKPTILASVGNDFAKYHNWLQKCALPNDGIRHIQDLPTASAYITTDQTDNQITAFNPGAMNFPTHHLSDALLSKDSSLAIVSPGNLEDMQEYPKKYKALSLPYIFDPGQNIPAFSGEQLREMITGSIALIANDYELSLIMEATHKDKKGLLEWTPIIITTLGEQGARISQKDFETEIPAVQVSHPVDPTGAGDAFRAGLLKGLSMAKDTIEAARMGAVCASFSVECLGTQEHYFTHEEYWQRYHKTFDA